MGRRGSSFAFVVACLFAAAHGSAWSQGAAPLTYPKFGFSVQLPADIQPVQAAPQQGAELFETYVCQGVAYGVVVLKSPRKDVRPSVLLEQALTMVIAVAPDVRIARWQANSAQGLPFNGFSVTVPADKIANAMEPWMRDIVGSDSVVQSGAVADIPGLVDTAVGLFTMGPKSRAAQVEQSARSAVGSLRWLNWQPGERAETRKQSAPQYPHPQLKAGEIQVCGVVDLVSAKRDRLTVLVDEATVYGGKPARLDPPREKTVLVRSLPDGIVPGSRILAIGKNAGAGKPLNADRIEPVGVPVAPASPPGGDTTPPAAPPVTGG